MEHVERRVAADWGEIHVEAHGSGPPVLLLQGLGFASWAWKQQSANLPGRTKVVVDNRGAGRSSKPEGPYSIEGMARDAALVLESMGETPAHVVGFSMGGYIAQALAIERPDLVSALVIVSSSNGGPEHEPTPAATLDAWLEASPLSPEDYARATMHLAFAPGWVDDHPDGYEEQLAARLEHPTPGHAWAAQYRACVQFLEEGVDASSIAAPTLVVHGDADRIVPLGNGLRLHSQLPDSRLFIMESHGHLCFIEDSASFNGVVSGFLRDVESKGGNGGS